MLIEEGGFYGRDPRKYKLRIALIYPGPYKVAVSSLGHQILYFMMNSIEGVMAERFVSDLKGSVESGRPIEEFDLIMASLHFEGQYHTLLKMTHGVSKPLIVGGPAVSFNPLPMSPLVKAVGLGDGEGVVEEAVTRIMEDGLSAFFHDSFFFYERKNRAKLNRASKLNPLLTQIKVSDGNRVINKFLLEVSRGCSWGCRFCGLGWHWRPRVDLEADHVREALDSAQELGFREVYLIGSDAASSGVLKEVLSEVVDRGLRASVPSLRANQVDSELIGLIREAGEEIVTLAPETGSEDLRKVINKRMDNDEIIRAVEEARDRGIKRVKLYFMVGLPFERLEDVIESANLANKSNSILKTKISLSIFVPKAGTPFEKAPLLREEEFKRRVSAFSKIFDGEINVSHYGRAFIQAILSLGGFEIGELIRITYDKPFNKRIYYRAADSIGIDVEKLLFGERETPWWDYVNSGIPRSLVISEFERARRERGQALF